MKVNTKIQKWGNGLAIRISGMVRDIPHFSEGTPVCIDISEDGLIVRKLKTKLLYFPFTESELIDDLDENKAHSDIITHPIEGEY